jgi:magnesium transporter
MPASIKKAQTQEQLGLLSESINDGSLTPVARMLNGLKPQDVAHLLESSPPKLRQAIWALVDLNDEGDVLQYLSEEVQLQFLSSMDATQVLAVTEGLETDDIADILQQLPNTIIQEVLASMDQRDRQRVERVLNFSESSSGGLMSTEIITVPASITVDVVMRYLRRHAELPENTDCIYVVSKDDSLIGVLSLIKLLVSDPSNSVREVMQTDFHSIPVDMSDTEVALLFERNDWISAPVVNPDGKLLGRITIDDAVDVLREDLEHNILSMAGLSDDEDTFASIKNTIPRRATWLGINLLTAILASGAIKMFEDTIEKVVALAVLMPIVASMGGVAGSQTLTVMIRGMALGQIGKNNSRWLLNREVTVAFVNGILWASGIALVAGFVYNDYILSFIIAVAMIINLMTSAMAGTLLPIALKKLRIDPALAGGVLLTTVTDVVGFVSFLGLATWFYA